MTAAESGRAGARDLRMLASMGWREAALALDLGKRYRTCGLPFGRLELEPRKGVYNVGHPCSSCNDGACPRCGLEDGLRRWAVMVLGQADHVSDAGFMTFVSVAPRHRLSETAEAKLARVRLVTDWLPGSGEGSAGRRWMAANGVEKYVRVIEPTLGGWHGVNFGAHYLLFCRSVDDEAAEYSAGMLGQRLQQALGDWVAERVLAGGPDAEALSDEWGNYLADVAFHSELAGVAEVARYMTKLADGPGVGGSASELADPTGTKRGKRNVSMRAFSLVVAEETLRLGYRQPRTAIRQSERLQELVGQFGAVLRARSSPGRSAAGTEWPATKMVSSSKGLFAKWASMPFDELLTAALAVVGAADPAAAVAAAQLAHDDDDDGPEVEEVGYDRASQAFHRGVAEDGSVDHDDDDFFRVVALDEEIGHVWNLHDAGGGQAWGVNVALCHLFDQRGAWGGVVALRDAVRVATGERLFLYAHGQARGRDDDGIPVGARPKLLVTAAGDVPGWEPVDWDDAEVRARGQPRRRRMTRIELAKVRAA